MSNVYVGELQDYEGNTVYPHTEATVVWLPEGQSVAEFIRDEVTDDQIKQLIMGNQ